jgi:hypothetical protein
MADEIADWLTEHGLGEIGGLLDKLLAVCDDLSDIKDMEEDDLGTLVTSLGLKLVKAKKVARRRWWRHSNDTPPLSILILNGI